MAKWMVNRQGGRRGFENRWCRKPRMGFECARHPPIGRSTGREVGIRRKRIGCASIVDQDHGLPPWRVNQGGP